MKKQKRLTKRQRSLTEEYFSLVPLLGGYFLQHRPPWQRGNLRADLEGEGFLALCKAARTYDPKRLPYPRAYFARAVLNAMLKWIRKATRQPRENRVSLNDAEQVVFYTQELDHLRLAIEALPEDEWEFACERFMQGSTLRQLAADHQIPVKHASARAHSLATALADSLGIHLPQPMPTRGHRPDSKRA